jgi:large subunit ribosomal protein L9
LTAITVEIARRVGDTEQLYGSVTASDIAEFLKGKGFDIDRRKLILPEPLKAIGEHEVPLKLHRDVTVPLKVHVVREGAAG